MIISLHMPKTAGTSFSTALQEAYRQQMVFDYGDMVSIQNYYTLKDHSELMSRFTKIEGSGIHCVHGHFLARKYSWHIKDADTLFITWLRHPVERVLSHYYYWQRVYDESTAGPFFRRVIEEGWNVERFCLAPEVRNIYGAFLNGFPVSRFNFIGITEFYDQDLAYLAHMLGKSLRPVKANVRDGNRERYDIDAGFRAEIERYHAEDMALYCTAVAARERRPAMG